MSCFTELHDDTSAADKLLVIALASLLTVSVISAIGYVILDEEEGPKFNGKNLNKMDVYKFTLSDTNLSDFSLTELDGQVVVLAFVYTRCDDVCLLIANNLKFAKSQLTEEELRQGFIRIGYD